MTIVAPERQKWVGAVKLATANIVDCFILRDVFREDPYGDYILGQKGKDFIHWFSALG